MVSRSLPLSLQRDDIGVVKGRYSPTWSSKRFIRSRPSIGSSERTALQRRRVHSVDCACISSTPVIV